MFSASARIVDVCRSLPTSSPYSITIALRLACGGQRQHALAIHNLSHISPSPSYSSSSSFSSSSSSCSLSHHVSPILSPHPLCSTSSSTSSSASSASSAASSSSSTSAAAAAAAFSVSAATAEAASTLQAVGPLHTSFRTPSDDKASSATLLKDDEDDGESHDASDNENYYRQLRPSELVKELDRYVIGQQDAKRAIAVALRNRWRRHKLDPDMKKESTPKNILMIGPTGCGKTEIARRLARLTRSPFIKVEATKYTEVGFYGPDVDSIISDLVKVAIQQRRGIKKEQLKARITRRVNRKLLSILVGNGSSAESFKPLLEKGELEHIVVEVDVPVQQESSDKPARNQRSQQTLQFIETFQSAKREKRKLTIAEARPILEEMELDELVTPEALVKEAIQSVQDDGIVFIDEIDKIVTSSSSFRHADASSEGVQRDLLPLIEGTTVSTKQGDVSTEHILFVASGAFYAVKPSELMAELQGRLPIRVELKALTEDELYRVLTETEHSLLKQHTELLAVEKVKLVWLDEAIREIARVAVDCNRSVENIGARRLHTVVEKIMDDVSFDASEMEGKEVVIDREFVRAKVGDLLKGTDLNKFLL